MRPGRVIAVVIGVLLLLAAMGMIIGGGVLTAAHVSEREGDGYFDATLDRIATATAAITTGDVDLRADPGPPDWVIDRADATVRIQARPGDEQAAQFIGIGPVSEIEAYLDGVAREEIEDVEPNGDVDYRTVPGSATATPPTDQTFWVASASGSGPLVLEWDITSGEFAAVLMNSDGSPGIVADVTVGIRSDAVLIVGLVLLVMGALFGAVAVAIILLAALKRGVAEGAEIAAEPSELALESPVSLNATLDHQLSPWLWLVKWFLVIPHVVVLVFLWIGFVLATFVAGIAVLFTARYPRGLFDYNLGVLRWSWRVSYYAFQGGLGTDRYPPFSLEREDDYPTTLDINYPSELSRGLVLVKWWLLAIPHYLIIGLLLGSGATVSGNGRGGDWEFARSAWNGGLIGLLVVIAAVILLFTGRYPRQLFALIIGLNRWVFRVVAYVALMTDRYPPFRLDQGGLESNRVPATPPSGEGSQTESAIPPVPM